MADIQRQTAGLKPEQIVEIIFNRRWLILIPFCIVMTIGIIITVLSKKTYEASTTILIQPQKVSAQYVQSVVASDLNQRLNTISQQILSRSNLEKIIDQFSLFEDADEMYLEDKIANLRERITVKIERSRRSDAEAFSVSFKGTNPERVMRIANTLASYFMDENLKVREIQAIGTSEFLESELDKLKLKLEEKERLLAQFRTKYMGGLPDELEANLRTLDRLQQQLSDKQTALRDLKSGLGLMNTQLSRTRQIAGESLSGNYQVDETGSIKAVKTETEMLYENEKNKLDELLLKYTEKHPEVVKLKRSVERLKEKLDEEQKQGNNAESSGNTKGEVTSNNRSKPVSKSDMLLFKQEMQIKQLNNEILKTEADIAKISQTMAVYERRVEETPKREQELRSLQRDYENIRSNYNSLLDRQLESQIAVNMEKKQKGEQFRILDHARVPEKPISPDIRMLFMLSVAVGLGIGGGITFLLEFLDTTIKRSEQIEVEMGLPILASIPSLEKKESFIKRKSEVLLLSLFSLYAVFTISVFAVINYKGLDKTINFIKTQLNL